MAQRVKPRTVLTISVVSTVALALILLIPFPFRVSFSQPGFRLYKDSTEEQITVEVKGWHWKSLAGYDDSTGIIKITPKERGSGWVYEFKHVHSVPAIRSSGGFEIYQIGGSWYDAASNSMKPFSVFASRHIDAFFIPHAISERYDVPGEKEEGLFHFKHVYEYFDLASADSGKSAQEILEDFQSFIDIGWDA